MTRSADNRTVTLTAGLSQASAVAVVATSGVEDLSGNSLPDFVSSFTTAATADTGPPVVVVAQRPGTGAAGVAPDTSVVLYVNEAVNPATVPGAVLV